MKSRAFRRSLFVVDGVRAGDTFTPRNLRSIRPGHGLHTRHLSDVLGCVATRDVERGTPLAWDMVGERALAGAAKAGVAVMPGGDA